MLIKRHQKSYIDNMVCLRCGYCCQNLLVVIVDDPDKGPKKDNLIVHKGKGVSCKHLRGDKPGKYSCAVHNKRWYKKSPCGRHGQIERSPKDKCRLGVYVLTKEE